MTNNTLLPFQFLVVPSKGVLSPYLTVAGSVRILCQIAAAKARSVKPRGPQACGSSSRIAMQLTCSDPQ
jgi:hypothetical protein